MRGMKLELARGAVFIGAALGTMASAFGAAGETAADVRAISDVVTYSRVASGPKSPALTTYIGYTVTVRNTSGNTINNISFVGKFTVLDQQEKDAAFEQTLSDIGCTLDTPSISDKYGNSITVRCPVGQLRADGQLGSSRSFSLFFRAPLKDTISAPPEPDYAGFSGFVVTAEGPDAGNSPNDSVDFWPLPPVATDPPSPFDPSLWCATNPLVPINSLDSTTYYRCVKVSLGTLNATTVKSGVPKKVGTYFSFFTGDGGIPGLLANDSFTTTAKVPGTQVLTVLLNETKTADLNSTTCTRFNECTQSEIKIQDLAGITATFPAATPLAMLLRIDALNILKGVRIQDVNVKYTADNGAVTNPVQACQSAGGVPVPNSDGVPCIAKRTHYKTRGTVGWDGQPWTADLDGDFEIAILNTKNGKFDAY